MRVLMLNAFHWMKGGVERTLFDETRWLEAAGHEVAHFATQDPRNRPSPFARHFAPAADFGEGTAAWRQLPLLSRAVWSAPAARALEGLLAEWRPDVAHVHAPSRYLTPSVLRVLERADIPTVMTLHDYKPWCTNRLMFARGEMCERCVGGRHWRAATTGCVQHSRLKSTVGALEAYAHDALGAYRGVGVWLAPSRWMERRAVALGADRSRVRFLQHGVEASAGAPRPSALPPLPPRYVLFAGRLAEEKGVRLLPELALAIAPVPLVIAGDGPLAGWLAQHGGSNLVRLGHLEDEAFRAVRAQASAVVVPSLFPETFGYAVAEAQIDGRVVVASRIGALTELIAHERTGLLVPPGDAAALGAAVRRSLDDPAATGWGTAARIAAVSELDPARHLAGLVAVYDEARRGGRRRDDVRISRR